MWIEKIYSSTLGDIWSDNAYTSALMADLHWRIKCRLLFMGLQGSAMLYSC